MGLFGNLKKANDSMNKTYDTLKTNRPLTYEELLDIMKETTYDYGEPAIDGNGMMKAIRFPASKKYRLQVSISKNKIMVLKTYSGAAGLGKEALGNALFGGLLRSAIDKENLEMNDATRAIGKKISDLLAAKGLLA